MSTFADVNSQDELRWVRMLPYTTEMSSSDAFIIDKTISVEEKDNPANTRHRHNVGPLSVVDGGPILFQHWLVFAGKVTDLIKMTV